MSAPYSHNHVGQFDPSMCWFATLQPDDKITLRPLVLQAQPEVTLAASPIRGQPPRLEVGSVYMSNPLASWVLVRVNVGRAGGGQVELVALKRSDGQEGYCDLSAQGGCREVSAIEPTSLFEFVEVSNAVQAAAAMAAAGENQCQWWIDVRNESLFTTQPKEAALERGSTSSTTCGTGSLALLDSRSDEFMAVVSYLQSTMNRPVRVESVKKVQNEHQDSFFNFMQKRMTARSPGKQTPPRAEMLWHGTRRTPTATILGDDNGFDMRLSTAGMWGQGMYFAERAEYSDRYAHRPGMQQAVGHGGCFSFGASFGGVSFGPSAPPLPVSVGGGGGGGGGFNFSQPPSNFVQSHDETNGVKELILAEVLVGESCETQPDRSLRRPPVKTGTHLRYDSVNGLTGGSRVYVTYENGTARPVYLVSYRTG